MVAPLEERLPSWLAGVLACPVCHGALEIRTTSAECLQCGRQFPMNSGSCGFDFCPRDLFLRQDESGWEQRQDFFTAWLSAQDPVKGPEGDEDFFSVCAEKAGNIRGNVLDVGGGDGYLRRWLPGNVHYACVDPFRYPPGRVESVFHARGEQSPELPVVLLGVGEYLPFKDRAFTTVFCLGTLNHTSRPQKVLEEISRVLVPEGTLLITIEEVPFYVPLLYLAEWRVIRKCLGSASTMLRNMWTRESRASVQPDHIPLPPVQLSRWLRSSFELRDTFFIPSRGVVEMGRCWRKRELRGL